MSRRGVLRLFGAGAAAGGASLAVPSFAAAAPAPVTASGAIPSPGDPRYWQKIEQLFVIDRKVLFMNLGTVGSPPADVLSVLASTNTRVAQNTESAYSSFDDVRALAATGFGCDLDELGLTHNTSDGMAKTLAGLGLKAGDEILTTNHEHSGGNSPMAQLRDRRGVVITRVQVPVGNRQRAEDYVDLFRKAITSKTKVMLFSAPTYKTGTMLPIQLLAKLAQQYGLTTVVDGAHIPGMMNYRFRELGVDFLAGSTAKWHCGPGGTGVLYARNKVLPQFNPNPLPEFWPSITSSYPDAGLPPRSATSTAAYDLGRYLTSLGNGSLALTSGMKKAFEMWDEIGRQRIQDHSVGLASYLKELVAERWGVGSLYSPKDDPRLLCALTSFNPFRNPNDVTDSAKSAEFVSRMRSTYSITIRNVDFPVIGSAKPHVPVRISTHLFHREEHVERVVDAMWELSAQMA